MITISKFIDEWGDESKFNKWVFRGQKKSFNVISASIYRDLRILIDNYPYLKDEVINLDFFHDIEDNKITLCSSEKIAYEVIRTIIRMNRQFRIGLGDSFHDFLKAFYPDLQNTILSGTSKVSTEHLAGVSVHHDFYSFSLDVSFDPVVSA